MIADSGWNRGNDPANSNPDQTVEGVYYLIDWDQFCACAGGDNSNAPMPRHNRQVNVAFVDGHVKSLDGSRVIGVASAPGDAPSTITDPTLRLLWDPAAP